MGSLINMTRAWAITDEILERTDLDAAEKIVIAILDRLGAIEKPVHPSQKWLAGRIGMSTRGVKKVLERLIEKGWVQKAGKTWKINQYRLRGTKFPRSGERSSPDSGEQSSPTSLQRQSRDTQKDIAAGGTAAPWALEGKLREMESGKRRDLQVLALYYRARDAAFENSSQLSAAIKRDIRAAQKLVGYSDERIRKVTDWLDENADFKWTLETVHKYIDEDLRRLEKPREIVRIRS